jgi:TonB family protein
MRDCVVPPAAHLAKVVSTVRRSSLWHRSLAATLLVLSTISAAVRSSHAQSSAPETTLAATAPQAPAPQAGEVTEEELKRQLVGKPLFLRGGYLGDSLSFTEHGDPTGHPAKGSYTLSAVQIDKVRLTKHKVELEGSRYALHFLGAMPYEDPDKAVDRVKITPKKKVLKITIDREQVVKPKKEKEKPRAKQAPLPGAAPAPPTTVASSETDAAAKPEATTAQAPAPAEKEPIEEAEKPAEQAAEQAADPGSVTTTVSLAHAAAVLREALDKVFASGLDEKVKAQMPDFWQLYYQAQAAGVDYRPKDNSVFRSSAVDQQAKLTSSIAPDSNEYAQASGIAGRALYRAVIGPDGKPGEIAVVRPIGFGLDEKAVEAIRKATFQPAIKAGAPVAESLDLAVMFRIYSKRTSVAATEAGTEPKPAAAIKPGPFTIRAQQAAAQAPASPAPASPAPAPTTDSSQPQLQDVSQDPAPIVIPAQPVTETPAATEAKPETKPDPKPDAKPPAPNQP